MSDREIMNAKGLNKQLELLKYLISSYNYNKLSFLYI